MSWFSNVLSSVLPMAIGAGLGSLTGGVGTVPGWMIGAGLGGMIGNSVNQYENQDYMRGLQNDIFNREDNSVQRRIADLTRAGLSPTLAAGSSAGAGSVVGSQAAQLGETAQMMMSLMTQEQNIAQSKTQQKLMNQQLATQSHDLKWYSDHNLPTNATGWAKEFSQWQSGLGSDAVNNLKNSIKEKVGIGSKNPGEKGYQDLPAGIDRYIKDPVQRAKLLKAININR